MFVEVNSIDKGCPVIINLDHVLEIAPLVDGGCAIFTADNAGVNSKTSMKVSDSYNLFRQFAMQTVTAKDIAARFPKTEKQAAPVSDLEPEKKVTSKKSDKSENIEIPKL